MSEIEVSTPGNGRVGDRRRADLRRLTQSIVSSRLLRRVAILVGLAFVWQAAAMYKASPVLFPTFTDTLRALVDATVSDDLIGSAISSLQTLIEGYVLAVTLAMIIVSAATASKLARDVLQILTAIFNPLPAIALLPLAMLWLGLGEKSLLLVLGHSVLWPFALAALTGFEQVPETQRLVGRNYGLRGPRYILHILLPAALPSILAGLKLGWAFAWRTLIGAELVFGVSSGKGGLGWFIYRNRNDLMTDKVFAGLITVVLIGLFVEFGIFYTVQRQTVDRWGLQRAAR